MNQTPKDVITVLRQIQQTAAQTAAIYAAEGNTSAHIPWRMMAAMIANTVRELEETLQHLPNPPAKYQ